MVVTSPASPAILQLVKEGNDFGKDDKHTEALDKFNEALKLDPNFVPALRGKAHALRNLGYYREAMDHYDKAIENIKPAYRDSLDHYKALNGKGVVLAILGMYEEALKCYRKALNIRPDFLTPHVNMADIFYELGYYTESEEKFNAIIKECRNRLKLRLSDSQKKEYGECLGYALNGKAWLYANRNKSVEALDMIQEALDLLPEDSLSNDTKGYILYNLGREENDKERFRERMKQALEQFDKAEKQAGNNEQLNLLPIYHKGMVQIELKNYKSAKHYFAKALEINPRFAEALNGKAIVDSHDGNKDEAIAALREAIQFKPSLAAAQENLAKVTLTSTTERQSFWNFWSASLSRKLVAIILGIIAFSVILYPILVSQGYFIRESNGNDNKVANNNAISIPPSSSIKEAKIDQSFLVVLGIIIVILLLPEIKRVKMGSLELEMSREPLSPQNTLSI